MALKERTWKPVTLGKGKGGGGTYNISSQAVSSNWYNRAIDNSGTRYNRMLQINEADSKSVEISRALDVIAEDISSCNADNQDFFLIDYPDDNKIKKTVLKVMETMKDLWEERTCFDKHLYNRVRKTIKYGATFYRKNGDGTLTELPAERMVGYIVSTNDETLVTHYLYDRKLIRIDDMQRAIRAPLKKEVNEDKYEIISVNDLLVLKVGEGPFGESLVDKVYKVWKQIDMLEQAILIYRIVRAPEKRVYYIDTGNLQGAKRDQAINAQRLRLMQKKSEQRYWHD